MELVEGPTLADRIAQGPVPLDEALAIARQIAEALEAAHEQGIVHRDLKPANIKVRPDGTVKVLDFGLAKLAEPGAGRAVGVAELTMSPTITSPAMTQAGVILGTAAYMSPEQARGRAVDQRADIWAFGVVLYEMLAGQRPFKGDDLAETLASVVKDQSDLSKVPVQVRRLIGRCLEKDPQRRLRAIGDAWDLLDDGNTARTGAAAVDAGRRRLAPWAVAAVACVVALGAGWSAWARPGEGAVTPPAATRLELTLPPGVELFGSTSRTVASSPDGRSLAFVGTAVGERQLFLRRLDRFEVTPVRGTEGATTSFFSPDGRALGFATSAGELRTVSLTDGLVTTAARGASILYGAAWTGDDHIVYVHEGALWAVPRGSGEPKALTTLSGDEVTHVYPTVLAGDRTLLFAVQSKGGQWHIESLTRATGQRQPVLSNATMPLIGPGNRLFFYRDGQLLVSAFDIGTMTTSGSPEQVLENLPSRSEGVAAADVSPAGMIVVCTRRGGAAPRLGVARGRRDAGDRRGAQLSQPPSVAGRRSDRGAGRWGLGPRPATASVRAASDTERGEQRLSDLASRWAPSDSSQRRRPAHREHRRRRAWPTPCPAPPSSTTRAP